MANIKQVEQQDLAVDDRALLLATNHRYFVRQVVSVVCELLLVSLICAVFFGLCLAITGGASSESTIIVTVLMVLASLGYLALFVWEVTRIIKLHKQVTQVEDACIFSIDGEEWESVHQSINKN